MDICKRLRQLREAKGLSQGAIEKRTGLLRCYVSRVECGHTVPTLETVERWAMALDLFLWEVFAEAEVPSESPQAEPLTPYEKRLLGLLKKIGERDRALFISVASKMAGQGRKCGG
jgi:transcriptional regulator with XRE-family HTH domain